MKNPLIFAADTFRNLMVKARSGLDQIRGQIDDLVAEHTKISSLPQDRGALSKQIDRVIADQIERFGPKAYNFSNPDGQSDYDIVERFNNRFSDKAIGAFGTLCALFPDRMREILVAALPVNGLTETERTARLAKIDADILALEISEEFACREIEKSTGSTMPRRDDANPAILLAPDSELF